MEVINTTPFNIAYLTDKISSPHFSLSCIVKATFSLEPNKYVKTDKNQPFPTGDEFYHDDPDMIGSIRYPSDFSPIKPKADLLLVGKAFTPDKQKLSLLPVVFSVGQRSKQLFVHGQRYFSDNAIGGSVTKAELFSECELRYENSLGGEGYTANPVGKGIAVLQEKGATGIPLPNILPHSTSTIQKTDKPGFAGFGPIRDTWEQRSKLTGSYGGNYLKTRWPWRPHDFDFSYYNVAPDDMQVTGYLRGDEELYFQNLHPVHSQYRSQLPGIQIKCFTNKTHLQKNDKPQFNEIEMNLDTLWVDMEKETVTLVWRGIVNNVSEDLGEFDNLFVHADSLTDPQRSLEDYKSLFDKALSDCEAFWSDSEPASDKELNIPESSSKIEKEPPETVELDKQIAENEKILRTSLIMAGLDPDNLPQLSEEDKAKEQEMLKTFQATPKTADEPLYTRELVEEKATIKESFAEKDLSGLDLSLLDLKKQNFQNCLLRKANFKGSNLTGTDFSGANLIGVDFTEAILVGCNCSNADANGAIFTDADLSGAILNNAIFENTTLVRAKLNKSQAEDVVFSNADLSNAQFVCASAVYADFSNTTIEGINFLETNLSNADFSESNGQGSSFFKATLDGARITQDADFRRTDFRCIVAKESVWEGARLDETDFSYTRLKGADFSASSLQGANLSHADLKFATMSNTNLRAANCQGINLFQGSLEKANLDGAVFKGSNLYGVEFFEARTVGTQFGDANLLMTKLEKKEM